MKIVLDSNLGNVFARMLTPLIDPGGLVEIVRAIDMEWHDLEDDMIVSKAWQRGFTHMVTCDKRMPSVVVAPMPILVIDDVVGDRRFMHDTAIAVANMMNSEQLAPGYHPVPVAGHKPSRRLRRMLEGKHHRLADATAQESVGHGPSHRGSPTR